MQWPREKTIDLPDLNEDDLMEGDDVDSKPIDLEMYKEKLNKKLAFSPMKTY
jgi:hypothetical protein